MEDEYSVIESKSLCERIVMLALADAEVADETPIASLDVRPRCLELSDSIEAELVSTLDEADVMRALGALGSEPYIEEVQPERSPVGKGRPQYELDTEPETVLEALATDERLEQTVEVIREE